MALRVRGLVKRYRRPGLLGARRRGPPAVAGVDLDVGLGEVVGIIGESGSGKTTLIRAALGLLPFEAGEVTLLGEPLRGLSRAQLRAHRRRFQLLFQDPTSMLNPGLTVRAHLRESARLHRPDRDPEPLVEETAALVGIDHRLDAFPRHLSGGERRRVGLARLLVADPVLLVADEPTAGLDAALKAELIDLVLARRGAERAFLLVSHDLPLMAYACDRLVVMYAGRVIERFPVSSLGTPRHHPYTAGLLSAAGLGAEVAPPPEVSEGAPPASSGAGCAHLGPCPIAADRCRVEAPALIDLAEGHAVACHLRTPEPRAAERGRAQSRGN